MTGHRPLHLILADDDTDDCMFFKEALDELEVPVNLTVVGDGVELMELLSQPGSGYPHAIYLDLNMPRKNGFECLLELKKDERLKLLPIFIYSTSINSDMVERVYKSGASHYIRKPAEFQALKDVLLKSIRLIPGLISSSQTPKENFIVDSK
jgi:CheY-like chemotaxis protein